MEELNSHTVYKEALYYACTMLIPSLEHYLGEEKRYYGKVKSYLDSIKGAKESGEQKMTDSDKDIYGKVLGLIRIQIKKDFMRLGNRRMSCADRIIIICRWILRIVEIIPDDPEGYKYQKESGTFSRVLEHMFDNIRNNSKNDKFTNLTKLIERSINNGEIGNISLLSIDLINSGLRNRYNDPRKKKELKIKKEKIIKSETKKLIGEIDLDQEDI